MEYYIARDCVVEGGNKIWVLQNIVNGQYVRVADHEVKNSMCRKRVDVANLTLTSDDRLVKASEYKFEAFKEMMQAPKCMEGKIKVVSKEQAEKIESSIDKAIAKSLKTYSEKYKKYCVVKETDSDKNLLVAQFKVGTDTFILAKYQKVVYGTKVNDENNVYFDILVGIEAIRCGNMCEHLKAVPSRISHYAKGNISDELSREYNYEEKESYIRMSCKYTDNAGVSSFELDNVNEELAFAELIMRALADQMDEVVIENPSLCNNVDVSKCIEYDENRGEYVKSVALYSGVGVAGAVVLGAISAVAIATNPEILQTGLLAKIAQVGTPEQIITAIRNYSLVGGGFAGTILSAGALKKADDGHMSSVKKGMKKSKATPGKTFTDGYDEEYMRKQRQAMRETAKQWEAQQNNASR